MTTRLKFVTALAVAVALALSAGYWWGASRRGAERTDDPAPTKSERKILYYRNPMGLPDTSPVPKKAPDGMDYVPVYADEQGSDGGGQGKGRVLYYRNPMGLPDTSPVPKKDAMGMDYAPVYEGETAAANVVKISADKVQKLGVKTETASLREVSRTIRAVGTLQSDERRLYTVTTKFDGWIQKLHVNSTGAAVRRGQALMDVYSPDLITAQQEYLLAAKGLASLDRAPQDVQNRMKDLMESALQRLRNLDISGEEIQRLQHDGKVTQYVTLRSRANGVVLDKPSVEGKRFMAGDALYQIADLTSVWLLADVFEQDLGLVRVGQSVRISVDAYPERTFQGTVTFIYPTVTPETRTAKVRVELNNRDGALKPAMYARVEVPSAHGAKAVTVPDSAVLDTGTRQLVLIRRGEGAFEPRAVRTGRRGDGYTEIVEGVQAGDNVVVSANFLIDAESNIKAVLSGLGNPAPGAPPARDGSDTNAKTNTGSTASGGPSPAAAASAVTKTGPIGIAAEADPPEHSHAGH